jgi:hypothetical protein
MAPEQCLFQPEGLKTILVTRHALDQLDERFQLGRVEIDDRHSLIGFGNGSTWVRFPSPAPLSSDQRKFKGPEQVRPFVKIAALNLTLTSSSL